jgi:hypothetical protein
MELNRSVTVDSQVHFCKVGTSLATRFLAASRDAVILAGAGIPQDIAWRVQESLASMLIHRAKCRECATA